MTSYAYKAKAALLTGIRACVIPISYDAFLFVYSGDFSFHAPFLYPICFLFGFFVELDGKWKDKEKKSENGGRPPA